MATSPPRRRSSGFNPLLVFLLLVIAVLGTVGTLHATGRIQIDAIDRLFGKEVIAGPPAGKVPVLISARPLQPGHRVERADLWDLEQNTPLAIWIDKDILADRDSRGEPAWKRTAQLGEVEGRVMAREKIPGKTFTEGDFLPPGSQEGAVGLVPDGMRLVPLDSSKVKGLDQLRFRDRFDLVVSEKADSELFSEAKKALERQNGTGMARKLELASLEKMAHQKVLVQGGVLIQAATKSANKSDKTVQVAVSPGEVMPLLEALDLGHTVHCVAYSGKAGVEVAMAIPPDQKPLEKLQWIWESVQEVEVYQGNERKTVAVPKRD